MKVRRYEWRLTNEWIETEYSRKDHDVKTLWSRLSIQQSIWSEVVVGQQGP